ncbi:MAG: protein kinase [Acidobacteria bacterium]|nr:protein kinase [Acidobacteriota bacterium]
MPIESGTLLGPYEIQGLLGAGGMGEVYRAHDSRLDRDVAVKVLSPHLTSRADVLERFEREAKVVAALSHPHIVSIFDVGHDGDLRYVVTELLEGQTLRERIGDERRIDYREALRITLDVARALAAAHARGITHRDIKPENIFLTVHGAKVLDFGIARLDTSMREINSTEQTIVKTPAGFVLGTVGYMSPEQAAGEETGPASDIFSLGCVLYEMLVGSRPFARKTAAETMHAIMKEEPRPLPAIDAAIQSDLESIVMKSLEKNVEDRFPEGEELRSALDALLKGDHETLSGYLPVVRKRGRATLAVLDLETPDEDPELESVGMTVAEEIQNRLANETALEVVARSRIRKLGARPDPEEAGSALEATLVIAGSIRRSSGSVLVQLQLIDTSRGAQIWGGRERLVDTGEASIEGLISNIVKTLGPHLPFRRPAVDATVEMTSQPELSSETVEILGAVRSDLSRGTSSGFRRAIEALERAVTSMPAFALGHARLAEARLQEALNGFAPTSAVRDQALSEASRAEAIHPSDETKLACARMRAFMDWKWEQALTIVSGLRESPESLISRAEILVCVGRPDEAVVDAKRAVVLDSLNPELGERATRVLYFGRRWIDAQEHGHRTLIQRSSAAGARIVLALALARQGMFEEAHDELQALSRERSDYPEVEVALAELYALWGKRAGASKAIRRLDKPPRPRYVPQTLVARIESVLGSTDAALDRLDRALEEREVHLAFLRVDAAWDPIRHTPRFRSIEARVLEGN